jgi:tetratricopeptide (TPR) repeat protein
VLKDARDLPVTTGNAAALAHFETALEQFQSYTGDPIATIDQALEADPEFVLGQLFKAGALFTASEGRFRPLVNEAIDGAEALANKANGRERLLLAALQALADGQWDFACRAFDRVLIDFPRDAFALQTAHLMDFYRGDTLNLRNRVARVLPHWDASMPGYSYVLGMHAFGLEECNQYADAERTARRALDLQPKDGWAVHAVAHVLEMQGRVDEGIAWIRSREADWAGADNAFAPHNWWHLALFHLDRGEYDAALALYDAKLVGTHTEMMLVLVDATALLWRLRLEGVDVGNRFEFVAALWFAKQDAERGFYAFNDVHASLAFAATGRIEAGATLRRHMRETAVGYSTNGVMTREVGLPLAQAVADFGSGRYAEAATAIETVRDVAHRFGGSHAQRDLLTLTLIEAARRAGHTRRARHYIAERQVFKPTAWSARLLARMREQGEPALA